jgi:equilibrative nucleoside transporter 1/2/3
MPDELAWRHLRTGAFTTAHRTDPLTKSWHSVRSISHPAKSSWLKKVPGFYQLALSMRESLLRISLVRFEVK